MKGTELSDIVKRATELQNSTVDEKARMDEIERVRRRNYVEFWKLYKGLHWDETELDTDGPTPVKNKCFVIVNKGVSFLVGKPFTVNYPLEEAEQLLAPYVNILLKNSGGKEKFGFEATQMGSVSGDCFIKAVYDPNVPMSAKLQVMDSYDVGVRYTNREYQNSRPDKAQLVWNFIDTKDGNVKEYKEIWTDDRKAVFIDNELVPEETGINLLGKVPIIHIRNIIVGREVYGMSDIEQIEPLNKLLNHQIRRFKDDVDYHGDPITLLYGVRIGSMEKGEGKMWGNLPLKSKIENLELQTDFPAQQKFIEYMDTAIQELSSIPEESIMGNKSVSNTSGIAIHMNNLPVIELTDRKKITYGTGFEEAIKLGLELMVLAEQRIRTISRMPDADLEVMGITRPVYKSTGLIESMEKLIKLYENHEMPIYTVTPWNEIKIEFADYLPKDRLTEMNIIREKLSMGLISRRRALKMMGEDNIEEIMEEIKEEAKEFAETEALLYNTQLSMPGQPKSLRSKDTTEGMSTGTKVKDAGK